MRLFVGLLTLLISSCAYAQNVREYIPENAWEYRDMLFNELERNTPEIPDYNFVPALIEHESCISLRHSRCFNANSILSNKREHSIGFFQIAKAYRTDGSVRMDTLAALKSKYRNDLKEANWGNLANRPDLQMRAGTLLIKDNWNYFRHTVPDFNERMYFVDAAHNAGAGNINKDIRACNLVKGCDSSKWFGNVEKTCQRSKRPIAAYGNRSVCDINRGHVVDVFKVRKPKYNRQYFNEEYLQSKGK